MQRGEKDCVFATAAMIADISYEIAVRRSPIAVKKQRGLYSNEVLRVLEAVTGVRWRGPGFAWWRPLFRLSLGIHPVAVVIRRPWRWATLHCIALYQDIVYDPEYPGGCSIEMYQRRHWRVVQIYRPTDAERLLMVREYRARQRAEVIAILRRRARLFI